MTLQEIHQLPRDRLKQLIKKIWGDIAQQRNQKGGVTGPPEPIVPLPDTGPQMSLPFGKKPAGRKVFGRKVSGGKKIEDPRQLRLPIDNGGEKSGGM